MSSEPSLIRDSSKSVRLDDGASGIGDIEGAFIGDYYYWKKYYSPNWSCPPPLWGALGTEIESMQAVLDLYGAVSRSRPTIRDAYGPLSGKELIEISEECWMPGTLNWGWSTNFCVPVSFKARGYRFVVNYQWRQISKLQVARASNTPAAATSYFQDQLTKRRPHSPQARRPTYSK